jgi:hypothetical protein
MATVVSTLAELKVRLKPLKFPVFSLMIREFDAESSSYQTASSATQSSRSENLRRVCQKFA